MAVIPVTLHLPETLWRAVQALAPDEGDYNTVILRAVEAYVTTAATRRGHRSGKYLHLSARPAAALQILNIRYVYELVQKSQLDLCRLPNFGEKSRREVKAKLANLRLTLGMTLEDDAYRGAVVAAHIDATRG